MDTDDSSQVLRAKALLKLNPNWRIWWWGAEEYKSEPFDWKLSVVTADFHGSEEGLWQCLWRSEKIQKLRFVVSPTKPTWIPPCASLG